MHLFIFDFDMTLTVLQTDHQIYRNEEAKQLASDEQHQQFIKDNMKPGVADLFRRIWSEGHAIAIATFCNDKELLFKHLRAAELSELEIERITIEFRPDNFEALQAEQKSVNKNKQISSLIARVNRASLEPVDNFTLIDDSGTNTKAAKKAYIDCEVIRVNNFTDRDGNNHGSDFIDEVSAVLTELPPPKINNLDSYCASFFEECEQKINELDRFFKIYGTTKANLIRRAVSANKNAIQELKAGGNYNSKAVEAALKSTASSDGKTLSQALGYHRLFSFKSAQQRETANALAMFSAKHKFI